MSKWAGGSSIAPPSAPVALCAACCSWPPSATIDARVCRLAEQISDWDSFTAVLQRNRIAPLALQAFNRAEVQLPDEFRRWLGEKVGHATSKTLRMARECLRLQRSLAERGIRSLIVKGVPLGVLAYGALGLKDAWDIDLLVSPADAGRARKVLDELGYRLAGKQLTDRQFAAWVDSAKELVFANSRHGVFVELHWKLVDNPRVLRGVDANGPAHDVALPGGSLRTLSDEALFAYLCLHGTYHSWSRLKWLADLNAFVASRDPETLDALVNSARHYGAHRSASVALRLCQRLFELNLPATVAANLEQSPMTRLLERSAMKALDYRGGGVEHSSYTPEWARHSAARLLSCDSFDAFVGELRAFWIGPNDRVELVLPEKLLFLYHLLRVPLWLRRRGASMLSNAMARR